ncbi:MAG TPA: hypothetical protein VI932_05955 [Bacteroidota bacterium]|nr:hypothetical protein [Bacteroidota bacterium]
MKKIIVLCVLFLAAWFVQDAAAQPREHRQRKDRIDRVERLKQMRLIEELRLGEEEAVRFMAKRKEHEDRMKALAEERNAILDNLAAKLEDKPDEAAVEKELARVIEQDRKMFEERKLYQDEMKKILPADKFARLLIFERDFQAQVRNAMGQSMKKRPSKYDE